MDQNEEKTIVIPTMEQIETERKRVRYQNRYQTTLQSTIGILVVVAAIAVLVATLWLPVLQIYGSSMTPTLQAGDIVVSTKAGDVKQGDLVAFYYNNKILVKRVIATSGEWVDIDINGVVSVNDKVLDEPYIKEPALGECTIKLPYQVPESRIFVMGDQRSVSIDSRSISVGCVAEEQIVGKLAMRVWPLNLIEIF